MIKMIILINNWQLSNDLQERHASPLYANKYRNELIRYWHIENKHGLIIVIIFFSFFSKSRINLVPVELPASTS